MNKISKIIVAGCALAVTTFTANAQIKYGPVAGLNFTNLGGDAEETDMKIGFHIGGVVGIGLTEKLALEPGVQFSTKGAKYSFAGTDGSFKLGYIDVPINLRYYFGEDQTGFNIGVGPYLGFLMSAKNEDTDVKDGYNGMDFGLNIGVGYQLESGLGFGANYGLGLSDISKDEDGLPSDKITNTAIQISVRYMLGGDK